MVLQWECAIFRLHFIARPRHNLFFTLVGAELHSTTMILCHFNLGLSFGAYLFIAL